MNGDNGSTTTPATVPESGLPSNTYANAFVRGPPREGVQRVQNRLHKAKILTDELADYFAARRDLENNYLKSLQKIAKRSFLSDPSALGANFLPVYERLVGEIGELASIHGELERKLEVECELPMRNISSKGDWGRIKEHDDSLSSTLREISTLENQLSKDQKKAEGASGKKASQASQSVTDTERNLRQTMELWETEAPFAFEAYQRVDTQRLNLMKEVITKFETARSDAAQRLMSSSEQSMQVVLNFDPQVDMQEFALRNATAKEGSSTSTSTAPVTPRRTTAATTTAPPSSGLARRTSYGASTLLRRGTSNSNTNTNVMPVGQSNGLNEFGGREQQSSASIHSTDRSGAFPGASDQNTPSRSSGGGGTLKNALRRFGRGRSNKNPNDMQTIYGTLPEGPESTSMDPPPSSNFRGARKQPEELRSIDSRSDAAGPTSSATAAAAAGGAIAGSLMAPLAPTRLQSSSTPPAMTTSQPQVDAEGYSIPPPDRKPWETEARSQSPGLLDVDEDRDAFSNTPSKMTGMSISQRPLTAESNDQDQAALERIRSTLLTAKSPNLGPQRRNTANRRDRRDVRNTTYNSAMNMDDGSNSRSNTFGFSPQQSSSSPITASAPNAFASVFPGVGNGRPRSVTSLASTSQMGHQTSDSAVVPQGLHANITERVNVVFTGREITKIMVVGEVSVSVKDLPSTGPLNLRVEAFEQLEKAAPNPAFLKPIEGGTGQAGEYSLDVAAVLAQSQGSVGGGAKATLLKYQVFISPTRWNEYAPLQISSQWRCEDHQTSILINLTPNTELRSSSGAAPLGTSIEDVAISVDVTSPAVSSIMSKPTATYSTEQKKLYWKIADSINTTSDSLPSKALARFQVDQKSEIRPVEVRWRIPGLTLSSLGLSIVDPSSGATIGQVSRQTTSGKYLANP